MLCGANVSSNFGKLSTTGNFAHNSSGAHFTLVPAEMQSLVDSDVITIIKMTIRTAQHCNDRAWRRVLR